MTIVGNYGIHKTVEGYVLATLKGEIVGTFPTARAANAQGVALTAAAYKARTDA
jgi:hypothetical protein